jgi:hypothetical protein
LTYPPVHGHAAFPIRSAIVILHETGAKSNENNENTMVFQVK